jgi:phosphonate transport system substrate-binding protein
MRASTTSLRMGAVAYDPKVVTIWEGFRRFFYEHGLDFDFVLYSNYETQVEDLVIGRIDVAWNSPLAWIRARRLAESDGRLFRAVAMRDSDRDLSSVIVVRADSAFATVADLKGAVIATGAVDSPQATLLPLDRLRQDGIQPGTDVTVRNFDVGVGLHGDHIGGERDAAKALASGEVDAACMIDSNHLAFSRDGTLAPGASRILAQTVSYDHCNMTVADSAPAQAVDAFVDLLFKMEYAEAVVRPLLDLEGLKKWLPGRVEGYAPLERAVDNAHFYGMHGTVEFDGFQY